MSYVKYTKTSTFIFPLLEIPKLIFKCDVKSKSNKQIQTTRFLNSYLYDNELNNSMYNEGPYVFIVIKSYQDKDFDKFHSNLIGMVNYVDEYMKNDYLIMIFKVKDKFMEDYEAILNGKYSKIRDSVKKVIINNTYFSGQPYIVPLIFNRSEELRDSWERRLSISDSIADLSGQEVWGIIDKFKESLTKEILMEYSHSKVSHTSSIKADAYE